MVGVVVAVRLEISAALRLPQQQPQWMQIPVALPHLLKPRRWLEALSVVLLVPHSF
jgi:hypothetical protein